MKQEFINMRKRIFCSVIVTLTLFSGFVRAQDSELTNYKSGISVTFGGTKGTDYYEEYLYHDKLIDDRKIVYLKSGTSILMAHNERNNAQYPNAVTRSGRFTTIGINGLDGIANSGDEGIIRYKIDRDRQWFYKWAANSAGTDASQVLPAYTGPFTLGSQYFEPGVPVVGTTGWSGSDLSSRSTYFRGMSDRFGDEWHVISYADDDREFLKALYTTHGIFVDQAFYASDGKTLLVVVDPKTPCITLRASGTGQFYTTPPKAYFTPAIHDQTSYISAGNNGSVSIELRDINGNNVYYRINGGTFVNANASSVTLDHNSFSAGENTLEYYYKGRESHVKSRRIVKDPSHPSLSEPHGHMLWKNDTEFAQVKSRLTRDPYRSYYVNFRDRGDTSGQDSWNTFFKQGLRGGGSHSLENAFVAAIEGFSYKRSGASRSHGQYAKEMLLESPRTVDPLGFEMQHSSDAIPNRELHYRGYYDSLPILKALFAYDIMVSRFRSDQVAGGLTPIEDYYVRDKFAGFAYEAMQWSAGMTSLGSPGMWGGARMLTAQAIALCLREYSSPYYGTSGFGNVQTTYANCPYDADRLTWKQALHDGTATRRGYPNYSWTTGLSNNGKDSLFLADGDVVAGQTYSAGAWTDKAAYFSSGLMGVHLQIWANLMKRSWGGFADARMEVAFERASSGTFVGAKDPYPQPGSYFTQILLINSHWPTVAANTTARAALFSSTENNSIPKAMQDAGVFAFAWYDDQVDSATAVDPSLPPSNAVIGVSVSNP